MSRPSLKKQKHNLTHIPFQPWCTSCVKGKAQAEPHKRTERIIEDSELSVIQFDCLMLKDTAGTSGLKKVLSMYVRTFGYGMSTVVETKGPTDTFATMWVVKMLNFLGLSDIILQCDPEPSLIKWAESVKSKRIERTVIRSSPRRSHQSNGGVENYQKQLQGQVRTMLAAMQEHTKYRPSADNALMRWIVRHAAWLIPRFRGSEIQSPFYCAMGGPYRGKLVEFGETVLAHLPEVGKGSGNPAQNWQTDGNPACGWERATSQTSTLSERTMESCMREVYDDSQRTADQKKTSKQLSRPHRSRGR